MKFTAAFVTAAHAAAKKIADVTLTYRQKLSQAMKAAYAAAKAPVVQVVEFVVGGGSKACEPAQPWQYKKLERLIAKVGGALNTTISQFVKYVEIEEAYELLDAAEAGKQVVVQ